MARPVSLVTSLLVLAALAGGCATNYPKTVEGSTRTYLDVLDGWERAFEQLPMFSDKATRAVPLRPLEPGWEIGAVLDKRTHQPLTGACVVPPERLPPKQPVGELPAVWANATFAIDLDGRLPKAVALVREQVPGFALSLKRTRTAKFGYSELAAVYPYWVDVIEPVLNATGCRSAIARRDVLFVTARIFGKELTQSTKALGGKVEVRYIGSLKVSYDDSGGFEIVDTEPGVKFVVLTALEDSPLAVRNPAIVKPGDDTVRELRRKATE